MMNCRQFRFFRPLPFSFLTAFACVASGAFAQIPAPVIQNNCFGLDRDTASGDAVISGVESSSGDCAIGIMGSRFRDPVLSAEIKTRHIQLQDFQPGDNATHLYIFARLIKDSGVSASGFFPDDTGYAEEHVTADVDDEDRSIITSIHVETAEVRFTMDLVDEDLKHLLDALQLSKQSLERQLMRATNPQLDRNRISAGGRPQTGNRLLSNGRRLSIRTVNLSLEETLDLIFEKTGCSVFEEQGWLAIRECR